MLYRYFLPLDTYVALHADYIINYFSMLSTYRNLTINVILGNQHLLIDSHNMITVYHKTEKFMVSELDIAR